MIGQTEPAIFDGATVRLFAGAARWMEAQAPRRGRHVADLLLFDAGRSIVSADLLAGFWREEAVDMDWLEDFLCDPATDRMIAILQSPPEEEEEEEILYSKTHLVTVGTEMDDGR